MEPSYFGDLESSIFSYQKVFDCYEKALKKGEFYEEPVGEDSIYPDW